MTGANERDHEVEDEASVEEVDPRPFVLAGLGLDEAFIDLDRGQRTEILNDVEGAQLRRHIGRAIFYALLIVAFVVALQDIALYASCGAVAMIAGRDLGRFAHGRRLLAAARGFFLAEDDPA